MAEVTASTRTRIENAMATSADERVAAMVDVLNSLPLADRLNAIQLAINVYGLSASDTMMICRWVQIEPPKMAPWILPTVLASGGLLFGTVLGVAFGRGTVKCQTPAR